MTPTSDTYLLLRAFVDELVRCGVTDACTSPGSRSTPLVLTLVRNGRLRCHSHIDERAAGFFGLGLAKASRRPVVLACTSGTAAAEYGPAVIEAHESGVPLIVLTADRPPELREVGAGQAIDQIKLYGDAVRWFVELGTHDATPQRLRWVRSLACRVVHASDFGARRGPVHVNVALREPLVFDGPLPEDPVPGRRRGMPWLVRTGAALAQSDSDLGRALSGTLRPLVVAGRGERDPFLPDAIATFCANTGVPLLADPLSGARRGPQAIAHYDALLRDSSFAEGLRPDFVVRVGDLPTSKPLRRWLAAMPKTPQVAFEPESVWHDPDGALTAILDGDPAATLSIFEHRARGVRDATWLRAWRTADDAAAAAVDATLGDDALSEPLVARTVAAALPADHTLFVASSMPIRDVETFAAVRDDPPRVLSLRGANGIDGTVAAAFGAAADGPTTLLIGDVALAHDLGALITARRLGLDLTIVLLDNGGGGIFDFLPVATQTDAFEEHVATPPGLQPRRIAALFDLPHTRATTVDELRAALGSPGLVEVHTDRQENVALHRRVWAAVTAAHTRA